MICLNETRKSPKLNLRWSRVRKSFELLFWERKEGKKKSKKKFLVSKSEKNVIESSKLIFKTNAWYSLSYSKEYLKCFYLFRFCPWSEVEMRSEWKMNWCVSRYDSGGKLQRLLLQPAIRLNFLIWWFSRAMLESPTQVAS